MTVEEIRAIVTEWAEDEKLIRRVYLIGSRAKGTHRSDSDVDLAILHGIDPDVLIKCNGRHPVAHWWTRLDFEEDWTSSLQARMAEEVDLRSIDRDGGKMLRASLKACRICLYRRGVEGVGADSVQECPRLSYGYGGKRG